MDALLVKILAAQMKRMTGVAGDYDRWMQETRRILAAHGAVGATNDEARLWREGEQAKSRWADEGKGMTARAALVEATLRSLGEIVRGDKRATDVIFPNSSLALVEGVYKNNAVADAFNGVMADVVRRHAEENRGRTLRLLELGAGTGGSSEGILRTLDAFRNDVAEYCYSDLSKWFLLHGEQAYGRGREFFKTAVIDVEKGFEE